MSKILLLLPGDGIGPEVIAEVRKVVAWLTANAGLDLKLEERPFGGTSYDLHGTPLTDVARDLALDGSFAWLFDELGIEMADAAVPPGRDGRGSDHVHREADSSWNGRPRPKLDPRPVSESGWMPPKRARVLDASVTTVRHESETTKRYARSGELSGGELRLPTPRDNGSPGPSNGSRTTR